MYPSLTAPPETGWMRPHLQNKMVRCGVAILMATVPVGAPYIYLLPDS